MSDTKPRYKIPARSDKGFTSDTFVNFKANLGYQTNSIAAGSTYGFNPISRNHTLLEWAFRGSWIVKTIIEAVSDDMTREGITIESDMPPDDMEKIHEFFNAKMIWQRICSTIKWARLYGGCIAVIMIDGQKVDTPLRIDTIGKDQFQGLMVLDRWMLWPHLEDPVMEQGPHFGYPKYYEVVSDAKSVPHMKVHYSRCIRMEGVELPYWQKIAENGWGLSVLEPIWDRILAFDSTSQGAAQLVYRAHLRTLSIEKLRELIAFGGEGYQGVLQQIGLTRLMQSNEGLTVIDSTDKFESHSYNFGGLSEVMQEFAQQLSGACGIPITRLFGQSPAGLNATGESDIRQYYDTILAHQESMLRLPMLMLLDIAHRSIFGKPLPEGFDYSFTPLWQMDHEQKAKVALDTTNAVAKAVEDMVVTPAIAMKELRQSAKVTGIWSNITDEDIKEAEEAPPPIMDPMGMGMPGAPQPGMPGQPGQPKAPAKAAPGASQAQQKPNLPKPPKPPDPPKTEHRVKTTEKVTKFAKDELPDGVVLGPDEDSNAVWIVEQQNAATKEFKDFKYLLQFSNRDDALQAYKAEHGENGIGTIKRVNVNKFKEFIHDMETSGKYVNGHA